MEKGSIYFLIINLRSEKNIQQLLAITHLYEILLQYKDNDDVACGIFLDIAKTFDTVHHKILIDKLEHYGVRGNGIKLLKSYLTNRKQYFSTNDNGSKKISIATGLPQDSVLGPFFCLVYVNDLAICSNFDTLMLCQRHSFNYFQQYHSKLK